MNFLKKATFSNIQNKLPNELALKIVSEYSSAPDHQSDCIYFNISINQQINKKAWVYMVTFVTRQNKVQITSERTYPRELEKALLNIAFSVKTTLLNSEIEFYHNHNCCTAGLIGPLTKKQNKCNGCIKRKLSSFSFITKNNVNLQTYSNNGIKNIDYIESLIIKSIKKIKTRNRIDVYSVHDENRLNKNEPLLFRKLWIRIQKPVFPAWKLLCKNYNHKGTSKKNIKNDIIKADYDKNKFIYSTTFIGQKYGMVFKNGCYGQGYYPDKRDR